MRALRLARNGWITLAMLAGIASGLAWSCAISASAHVQEITATAPADPNQAPSEFNHHIAGWALIAVGLLVVAGYRFPKLRILPYVWPALFLLAGLFLALWSDGEMWPRGNVAWTWLLHHDAEARQHKIYAVLLIAVGVVEYLRARNAMNRFWRVAAFPILALVGASLLLIHDHSQGSGVHSPEVRAYLIDPARDPDGHVFAASPADPMNDMDHAGMSMDHAAMEHTESSNPDTSRPHHHMTPSMLLVQREHFWFMVVGIAIAVFKLISDAGVWRRGFVPYLWPGGLVILGTLLVLYHE